MRKMLALSTVLFFALLTVLARDSDAVMYKYVNEEGVICLSDDLQTVPEKLRSQAVIIADPGMQSQSSTSPDAADKMRNVTGSDSSRATSGHDRAFTSRLLLTGGVLIITMIALVALGRTKDFSGREKIIPSVRLMLVCGVLVYLVVAHGRDVTFLSGLVGKQLDAIEDQSAQRGKKAAEAIKSLNNLMREAEQVPAAEPGNDHDH